MSEYIPFPNEDYPDTSPEANDVGNYYYSIRAGTHPAIVSAEEKYKEALCETALFCCGPCNCDLPPCNGPLCPDSGCKAWWSPPYTIGPCQVDPIAQAKDSILDALRKARIEAVGPKARTALTQNRALLLSNTRLSAIFYNSMFASAESILIGMANTFLQAGAIAGAVAGASLVFSATMGQYSFQARSFLQSFKPFNPPPIGGGGGLG